MALHTAERTSQLDPSENVIFQRHVIAYEETAKRVSGKVLEIGSGEGYGIRLLAPKTTEYVAVDKFNTASINNAENVKFIQASVPPLTFAKDNSLDFVVSFQVIEHIVKDNFFVQEIHRVLKPGGKVILTTPNIKMSLTRNPWHVREYKLEELRDLLKKYFPNVSMQGVFGGKKVMDYYEENKRSVQKFTRYDIFNLQYRLPRQVLQIPYDIMNRMNRKKLLKANTGTVQEITSTDFYLSEANDTCLDFYCIAEK